MKNKLLHIVSGNYLSERIPVSIMEELTEEDILIFIEDHLWQPLEQCQPADIWSSIQGNVDDILDMLGNGMDQDSLLEIIDAYLNDRMLKRFDEKSQ